MVPIGFLAPRFSCFKSQVSFLASYRGDVTFTIHNRVKIHNLNEKKTKNNIFNKKKRKREQTKVLFFHFQCQTL